LRDRRFCCALALAANSNMTPIITSFTNALVACTKAGYRPTWFKPEELVRK
jgi:hypothetical protein